MVCVGTRTESGRGAVLGTLRGWRARGDTAGKLPGKQVSGSSGWIRGDCPPSRATHSTQGGNRKLPALFPRSRGHRAELDQGHSSAGGVGHPTSPPPPPWPPGLPSAVQNLQHSQPGPAQASQGLASLPLLSLLKSTAGPTQEQLA